MLFRHKAFLRITSAILLVNMISSLAIPVTSYALTSGPAQPEFTSFEPVATTNMVNQFGGDFTYNLPVLSVPGPNGSTYPLSLSYHSGVSSEEESSWVGLGWTLNPGAINRSKLGFPDDHKAKVVRYINEVPDNITVSAALNGSLDLFSNGLGISASRAVTYNNFRGYAASNNLGLSVYGGTVSVGYGFSSDGQSSFSYDINPAAYGAYKQSRKSKSEETSLKQPLESRLNQRPSSKKKDLANKAIQKASSYLTTKYTDDFKALSVAEYSGNTFDVNVTLGATVCFLEIAIRAGITGTVSTHKIQERSDKTTYGYLYSGAAGRSEEDKLDYTLEKDNIYTQRNKYLPIPFSSADMFAVTGEGLGGSFRLHSRYVGVFRPNKVSNSTQHYKLGLDPQVGVNLGLGVRMGAAEMLSTVDQGLSKTYGFAGNSSDEAYFFRFSGDQGGNLNFSSNDQPFRGKRNSIAEDMYFTDPISNQANSMNGGKRVPRSSYIGYHTFGELSSDGLMAFEKDANIITERAKVNDNDRNLIAEIAQVNEQGSRYVYGLPVLNANETSMAYTVPYCPDNGNSKIAYPNLYTATSKVGEISGSPYASTYLLTSITTPDYIDRQFDGVSDDDFGGWTKFGYTKITDTKKYNWRFPYCGTNYIRGSISDIRDDKMSYSSGSKDIFMLNSIETKTHIAIFTTEDRTDGLPANSDDLLAAKTKFGRPTDVAGAVKLQKLVKIELFKKDAADPTNPAKRQKIRVVNFDYFGDTDAGALCKGIPNSSVIDASDPDKKSLGGKLTLKRVWFEYNDIVNSKISPYEFSYEYKHDYLANGPVSQKYGTGTDILTYGTGFKQNPNYDEDALDTWGNIGYKSKERNKDFMPWVYQEDKDPIEGFDPAAWNLKTITLPTGGQIVVQYEQHEYAYVQDQQALFMVGLLPVNGGTIINADGNVQQVKLNINNLSLPGSDRADAVAKYVTKLNIYADNSKIFTKFLYALQRNNPSTDVCSSEYITGYLNAKFDVDPNNSNQILLTFVNKGSGYYRPQQLCHDFYMKNKAFIILNDNCTYSEPFSSSDAISAVTSAFDKWGKKFSDERDNSCLAFNPQSSFVRLPVPVSKKGGGVRVKRIMLYDKGLTTGKETLYGSEYIYENEDGTSSGVATNEPMAGREENALIDFMQARAPQSMYVKLISGTDREEFEGPLGETILPSPSIGYSKVIVKSIHAGTTSPGFNIYEYYTAKDFPLSRGVQETGLDAGFDVPLKNLSLSNLSITVDRKTLFQGYSFVQNDMHGKQKRVASLGGKYEKDPTTHTYPAENNFQKSEEEIYEYYAPGEKVDVMKEDGSIGKEWVGRTEEVVMDSRRVVDDKLDISVQTNLSMGFVPPPIFVLFQFTMGVYVNVVDRRIQAHVTNKLVHYSAIQKRVVSSKNGMVHVSENRVFDYATGSPIVTVSSDNYTNVSIDYASLNLPPPSTPADANEKAKNTYTNYQIPAHYIYKGLLGKYINQDYNTTELASLQSVDANAKKYSLLVPVGPYQQGDLVRLKNESQIGYFHIDAIAMNGPNYTLTLYHAKGIENFSPNPTELRIVSSGYQNRLKESAGSITTYHNEHINAFGELIPSPLKNINSNRLVQSGSLSNILSSNAVSYSNYWPYSDYVKEKYFATVPTNPYMSGEKGRWNSLGSYTYKTDLIVSEKSYVPNYFSGAYDGFDYNDGATQSNKWLLSNKANQYSPNGDALEETNILGVCSSAKFGYSENVPVVIAKNSAVSNIYFNAFEDITSDGTTIGRSTKDAHSGSQYLIVLPNTLSAPLTSATISNSKQLKNKGLNVRMWTRLPGTYEQKDLPALITPSLYVNGAASGATLASPTVIARTGDWTLIEFVVPGSILSAYADSDKLSIGLVSSMKVYIDDFRLQPTDASLVCYVYDPATLKLLTSFDDQHFGLIYQYNAEGKLIRKLIETERGVKTITETLYNTPSKVRH